MSAKLILAALLYVAPELKTGRLPLPEVAQELHKVSEEYGVRAGTIIEYVDRETRWISGSIGKHRGVEYVGLGQHRLLNYEPCRQDGGSMACEHIRASLLDWRFNIRETARLFWMSREYCFETVGSRKAEHWLQLVQGYDAANQTTCGHVKKRGRWVKAAVPAKTAATLAGVRELRQKFGI